MDEVDVKIRHDETAVRYERTSKRCESAVPPDQTRESSKIKLQMKRLTTHCDKETGSE
jgi:hypothetical protein